MLSRQNSLKRKIYIWLDENEESLFKTSSYNKHKQEKSSLIIGKKDIIQNDQYEYDMR